MSNVHMGLYLHNLLRAVVYSNDKVIEGQSILSSKLKIVPYIVMHF
jgi:hypothetical protein